MHERERRRRNQRKREMLNNAGVMDFNNPVATPDHPRFNYKVLAKQGERIKLVRFGKKERTQINKPDKLSAAYWENQGN